MFLKKRVIYFALTCSIIISMSSCTYKNVDSSRLAVAQTGIAAQKLSDDIHIDQVGYKTSEKKITVIKGQYKTFEVYSKDTNQSVLKKNLSGKINDNSSGDTVCFADFSELVKPGEYYIYVEGLGKSNNFKVNDKVYDNIGNTMLKALYFQRCGIALDTKYAGGYAHGQCHKSMSELYENQSQKLDVSGGWHDASDYGRYVVPAAVTAADLMLAYEFYPNSFNDNNNIPQSGNRIPDILDEVRYGIEWMLKMQDAASGGVYHKVTARGVPDLYTMPDKDVDDQFIMPISTAATADFAAATAMAARVFKTYDNVFAQKCLLASQKAWGWLETNTKGVVYNNPQDVTTVDYSDDSNNDEITWAAAELLRATGDKKYNDYFLDNFSAEGLGLGWQNVNGFAAIAYLFTDIQYTDKNKAEEIRKDWVNKADMFVATAEKDGYLMAMHKIEYNWGSNMNVANHAIHLLIADRINNNAKYKETAENCAHYLLGRNTLSQSYITGFGSKQVMYPYHRPSAADTVIKPIPGLLVGGPDSALEDDTVNSKMSGAAPAKCYVDDESAYSTNEVSTYWNSAAIFLFAYMK